MPQSGTTDKCQPRLGIQESKKQSITWKCRKQRQQTNATPVVGFKNLRNNLVLPGNATITDNRQIDDIKIWNAHTHTHERTHART